MNKRHNKGPKVGQIWAINGLAVRVVSINGDKAVVRYHEKVTQTLSSYLLAPATPEAIKAYLTK